MEFEVTVVMGIRDHVEIVRAARRSGQTVETLIIERLEGHALQQIATASELYLTRARHRALGGVLPLMLARVGH